MQSAETVVKDDKKAPKYLRYKWKIDINEPCVQNMLDAINEDRTKFNYLWGVQRYCLYRKVSKVADILAGESERVEDEIIQYIRHMKNVEKLPTTSIRSARIAPLGKFFRNNRKNLNWDFISEKIGKTVRKSTDVAYTRDQIKQMLNGADERETVVILAFSSTGIRRGALPMLTFGDLVSLDEYGIYMISVYTGHPEQYMTYCTPEFRRAVEVYKAFRERLGEVITDKTPLIRKEWDIRDRESAVKNALPVDDDTTYKMMEKRAVVTGVRVPHKHAPGTHRGKHRHKNKLLHGMRKYFEVTLLDAGFDEKWLDMVEGHKLEGLRDNYYRPANAKDVILYGSINMDGKNRKPGFLELMGELTISDEARLERRVKVLEGENSRIDKLEGKVDRDRDLIAKMLELLPNIPVEQRKAMLELAFDQGAIWRKKEA